MPHYLNDYIAENFRKEKFAYGDSVWVKVVSNFQSLQKECVILEDESYEFSRIGIDSIHLKIFNPYPFQLNFKHHELPVVFQIAFLKNGYMEVKKNLELPAGITAFCVWRHAFCRLQFTTEDLYSRRIQYRYLF